MAFSLSFGRINSLLNAADRLTGNRDGRFDSHELDKLNAKFGTRLNTDMRNFLTEASDHYDALELSLSFMDLAVQRPFGFMSDDDSTSGISIMAYMMGAHKADMLGNHNNKHESDELRAMTEVGFADDEDLIPETIIAPPPHPLPIRPLPIPNPRPPVRKPPEIDGDYRVKFMRYDERPNLGDAEPNPNLGWLDGGTWGMSFGLDQPNGPAEISRNMVNGQAEAWNSRDGDPSSSRALFWNDFKTAFNHIDRNGNGRISIDEGKYWAGLSGNPNVVEKSDYTAIMNA